MKTTRFIAVVLLSMILMPTKALSDGQQTKSLLEAVASSSKSGSLKKIEDLIQRGADVNSRDSKGEPILDTVLTEGRWDIARLLIEGGADVNAKDRKGETPLHIAVSRGHANIVALLISRGSDVTATDPDGLTAWQLALQHGDADTAGLLISKLKIKSIRGGAHPLVAAAAGGYTNIVKSLLSRGCFVDAVDGDGRTALMAAASINDMDVLSLLLANGADVNARDNQGMTAILAAVAGNSRDAMLLLANKGADVNIASVNRDHGARATDTDSASRAERADEIGLRRRLPDLL